MNIINIIERLQQLDCNGGNMLFLFAVIASVVQISPIKINPWTWIRDKARDILGLTDLKEELKQVKENMDELDTKIDNFKREENDCRELRDALSARRRILRFNDELLLKIKHSKEMFNDILKDITDYDNYCRTHPDFKNKKSVFAEENVARAYQDCMENNSFL